MSNDASVLIKVDGKTKAEMSKLKINWSEAIRQFIKERLSRDKSNMALAVALSDKILYDQKKRKGDSTEIIRRYRDSRYGPGSR
jgi:hypothetical protein